MDSMLVIRSPYRNSPDRFFEVVYALSTRDERIAVTGDLRKPEIYFSRDWEAHPTRHKQIITWLLRHDLAKRPSALELSQNAVLPARIKDECLKGALRMMDSPYYKSVISGLFSQPASQFQGLLYDLEEALEHAQLNNMPPLVDSVVGHETPSSFENWCTLTKLHAFILESLRWRPINPLGVPHRAVRGVIWPLTSIPSRCVPRDPEVLPDPETFDINRWIDQDGNFNDLKPPLSALGGGYAPGST
ncbi:hypothetical protein BU15DRAFT_71130 [Melanogaster broomeanus]|nr:hypothetical protein BU15DRAFT_82165 [Melanogaster broomeanus]KAF9245379.1 hypothetical protein BU15DRAFT_71130 [Melanogaster broomeanus]